MLGDRTIISHLGLPAREAMVIRSLFQLVPRLQESFHLVESPQAASADVVFVNAELEPALAQWRELAARNDLAVPVMVVAHDMQAAEQLQVRRPLVLKKLLSVLERITATHDGDAEQAVAAAAGRILVVDDSFPVRRFMEHALPRLAPGAVCIDLAESGEEAQQKLGEHDYDLIFLDVVMPDIDGYRLCKWIKARHATPVILLTSRGGSFDKVRGAVAGCDSYLIKPPDESRLQAVLHKHVLVPAARAAKY